MKNVVNIELSLREARALARVLENAGHALFNPNAPHGIENQSEMWREVVGVETALDAGLAKLSRGLGGSGRGGRLVRYYWGREPVTAPFGRCIGKKVA